MRDPSPRKEEANLERYFAAANSRTGFVSWFDSVFDPRRFDKVYIIKGGSGTGKSTLMKKAAARAEAAGGRCRYFYCSSDPDSLDGLVINLADGRRIAFIDGTAPHICDPKYPACIESTVNMAEYLCEDILSLERDTIISLTDEKSKYYKDGYRALSYSGLIVEAVLRDTERFILKSKLNASIHRLLTRRMREYGKSTDQYSENPLFLSAITSKGEVHFDSFDDAELIFCLSDTKSAGTFLFDSVVSTAKKLSLPYDRAPSPLDPTLTEAVRFPTLSMSIVSRTGRSDAHPINMSRFIDRSAEKKSDRSCRRTLLKSASEMKDIAVRSFASAGAIHGELEKIYRGAMDFTRVEEMSQKLFARIGI